jgi:hypothetical protein
MGEEGVRFKASGGPGLTYQVLDGNWFSPVTNINFPIIFSNKLQLN